MKILRFTAENIKKLKVVEIVPDGSVVQITGPNGSGKSSVLDAIYWALAGTKGIQGEPIRKGEQKATIKLDLGEVVVTRKFAGENTSLYVEAANGARFPSPQRMLDELLGALTFDPLEFSRMEPRKQLETLRHLVPLDQDVDALDAANKADYDQRTVVNRHVKELQAQIDAIKVDPNLPSERVDVSALSAQIEEAGRKNVERERAVGVRVEQERSIQQSAALINEAEETVFSLRMQLEQAEHEVELLKQQHAALEADFKALEPLPEPIDTTELREQIAKADAINKVIDERDKRKDLQRHLKEAEQASQELTAAIDGRTKLKQDTIEAAKMPVDGLGFGSDGIIYNGIPFDQASSAEQLRVSVAIAMAANPKLRVLRIKDGSLLDESNLALIAEMAKTGDYQVWIERVDTTGKVGVIMEDGEVKEVKRDN